MEWFEYPYPRPDLMNKWSFARHSKVMAEKFTSESSKKKFDNEVHSLFKLSSRGKARADLSSLFECLYAAAKMEEREDPACKERMSFTLLYSRGLHSLLENYIHDPPCWKKSPAENDIVLYCMALTVDLAKFVIKSLQITDSIKNINPGRISNAIAIVRLLTIMVDKDTSFHKLASHRPLPPWILFHHRQYTKALATMPTKSFSHLNRNCENLNRIREVPQDQGDNHDSLLCGCGRCSGYAQESYLWIHILLEHFGCGSGVAGFDVFLDILAKISLLESTRPDILQLCESLLQFLSKVAEFLQEEKRFALLRPCLSIQGAMSRWHQTNQFEDKSFLGIVTLLAQHLNFIFQFLLPASAAKVVMATTNKLLQDLLISYESSKTKGVGASLPSSPCAIMEGRERLNIENIDPTTAKAMNEEVSRQMRQQLTKFVSELLAMLLPTLQSGFGAMIKQQYASDNAVAAAGGETPHHRDIFYPHPPALTTIETSKNKMAELSPPRSSAALGATMRNDAEIMYQAKVSSSPEQLSREMVASQVA